MSINLSIENRIKLDNLVDDNSCVLNIGWRSIYRQVGPVNCYIHTLYNPLSRKQYTKMKNSLGPNTFTLYIDETTSKYYILRLDASKLSFSDINSIECEIVTVQTSSTYKIDDRDHLSYIIDKVERYIEYKDIPSFEKLKLVSHGNWMKMNTGILYLAMFMQDDAIPFQFDIEVDEDGDTIGNPIKLDGKYTFPYIMYSAFYEFAVYWRHDHLIDFQKHFGLNQVKKSAIEMLQFSRTNAHCQSIFL